MRWKVVFFEQADTTQPAEIFEDALRISHPKLRGKLLIKTDVLEREGPRLGGGRIEKCHSFEGLWEIRSILGGTPAREFFGFDRERIVMLHGYTKRTGQPASIYDLQKASGYWQEYLRTRHLSPVQEEDS